MGSDLWQYILNLFDHWAALMTGGIPVAILAAWERWRNRNVTFRFYVAVFLVFGFVAASFQTWRDEYTAKMAAERSIALARDHSAAKNQLQKFYTDGGRLLRLLPKDISEDDFNKYVQECDAWLNHTAEWINKNMGEAATARFSDTVGVITYSSPNALNQAHGNIINGITNYRKNLQVLIVEFDAWYSKPS
jgi:sulfur relay (sulfurtransferase) DsrC/TusE family protein